jgi:hypothetical protein
MAQNSKRGPRRRVSIYWQPGSGCFLDREFSRDEARVGPYAAPRHALFLMELGRKVLDAGYRVHVDGKGGVSVDPPAQAAPSSALGASAAPVAAPAEPPQPMAPHGPAGSWVNRPGPPAASPAGGSPAPPPAPAPRPQRRDGAVGGGQGAAGSADGATAEGPDLLDLMDFNG